MHTRRRKKKGEATDTKATDDFCFERGDHWTNLQQKMQSKEYTSHAITQLYLTCIHMILIRTALGLTQLSS